MQETILKIKRLGSPKDFEYLYEFLSLDKITKLRELEQATKTSFRTKANFDNTVSFLSIIGFVDLAGDSLVCKRAYCEKTLITEFVKLFAKSNILHEFIPEKAISVTKSSNQITINNRFIPLRYSAYRNLLIEFNVLKKIDWLNDVFVINQIFEDWFRKNFIPLLENNIADFSIEKLKLINKKNEELGDLAEQFVLEHEQKVLALHPRVKDIKQISKVDVSAGYDIKSFISIDSIVLDKKIEVKSYSGDQPYFYWSRNEVNCAKESGDYYFLYLVNRGKVETEDYQPLIIKNPFKNIKNLESWSHEVEVYFFKKTILNDNIKAFK